MREGQKFIRQTERIIDEIEKLDVQFRHPVHQQVELKISIPRASYASYAFVGYMRRVKNSDKIKVHIKECNSLEALDHIVKNQYNLAVVRFETRFEEYYQSIIRMKELECETLMEFQYYLLVSKDSPLAVEEIGGYEDLEGFIEVIHGDVHYERKSEGISIYKS